MTITNVEYRPRQSECTLESITVMLGESHGKVDFLAKAGLKIYLQVCISWHYFGGQPAARACTVKGRLSMGMGSAAKRLPQFC